MAPERAHGDEPRPPVDLWSLGATLYAAVEGRPPFDAGDSMATLLAVVSEHPAPVLRAGPLDPVLRGLLTKDPAQRTDAATARAQLTRVAAGRTPAPAAPPPPPPAPGPVPGNAPERIEVADLLALASASRSLLGSVARDARDQARHLADHRRERKAAPRPRRRRFKRRWVVVPVAVTGLLLLLAVVGAVVAVGALLG
ncbi:hypothetical protein [Blastococcus sp. TML/C7B]|nr:hypothetical protein [Blastococcus sp. TML/C7B]